MFINFDFKLCLLIYLESKLSSIFSNQSDFKSNYGAKKKYLHTNKNFPKCSDFDDKRVTIRSRILPLLKESEEMADNELLNYLCTNLHEPNMILMCKF